MARADPATAERFVKWIGFAMGVKAFMLDEGVRRHEEDCPFCDGGKVTADLAGHKNHIVLACSTPGCVRMRE